MPSNDAPPSAAPSLEIAGTWVVQNPDQGESLPDADSRLLTGGGFVITSNGHVTATSVYRDFTGNTYEHAYRGIATLRSDGVYVLEYDDGHVEIYAVADAHRLTRQSTTRSTLEAACVLNLVSQSERPRAAHLPGIFLNTMPKSGSIYISRWLGMGLTIPEMKIAVCLFPDDLIIRSKLDVLAKGNAVCQQHVPAKDINLRFIANRLSHMAVHVRDPRQATLSWTHHLDKFYGLRDSQPDCVLGLESVNPALPDDYFTWDFSRKLDYQIETHLPQLIEWTDGWLKASQSNSYGLNILMTTFENFVSDPNTFIEALLAHFQIDQSAFDWSKIPSKDGGQHFRRGLTDEWKTAFSPQQLRKAETIVKSDVGGHFGWCD
ncbi:hypothetical protein [Magnetovibrio sp.]|uniref:hypothetical protein n=1 Tax=Magnetovibrio sp. TaxID=2024836 RepID=UPI002F947538